MSILFASLIIRRLIAMIDCYFTGGTLLEIKLWLECDDPYLRRFRNFVKINARQQNTGSSSLKTLVPQIQALVPSTCAVR